MYFIEHLVFLGSAPAQSSLSTTYFSPSPSHSSTLIIDYNKNSYPEGITRLNSWYQCSRHDCISISYKMKNDSFVFSTFMLWIVFFRNVIWNSFKWPIWMHTAVRCRFSCVRNSTCEREKKSSFIVYLNNLFISIN